MFFPLIAINILWNMEFLQNSVQVSSKADWIKQELHAEGFDVYFNNQIINVQDQSRTLLLIVDTTYSRLLKQNHQIPPPVVSLCSTFIALIICSGRVRRMEFSARLKTNWCEEEGGKHDIVNDSIAQVTPTCIHLVLA